MLKFGEKEIWVTHRIVTVAVCNMDKPCEICGDVGYEDVIRICSQCKTTREHAYCMRIVHEGDPEKWVCDECKSPSQIPLPSPVPSKQIEDSKVRFNIRKPPLNSKVRYITPEEAMGLESGAPRNTPSPTKIPRRDPTGVKSLPPRFSVKPNPRTGPPGFTKALKPGSMPSSSSDKKWSASTGKEKPVTHKHYAWKESSVVMDSGRNVQTCNGTREKVTGEAPAKHIYQGTTAKPFASEELLKISEERDNNDSRHTSPQLVQCLPAADSEKGSQRHHSSEVRTSPLPSAELHELNMERYDMCTEAQPKSIHSEWRESSKVTMKFDKFLPNHPAESPTWRGNFKVISSVLPCGFYDGIQAHPPSKVHRKVFEFSKQLPESLEFELLPRLNLWVEIFDDDMPGGVDIGLYFLPSKSGEQTYFCLVDYLNQSDVLLKSCISDVELLIFSSKHLQDNSQRIDQRYFLWGVFRCREDNLVRDKRAISVGMEAPTDHRSSLKVEDMVIDMIGGQPMGNVDVVVAKTARAGLDPTLEFSPAKVKLETLSFDSGGGDTGVGTSHRWTSFIEDELAFERELQRRFDRFDALMKGKDVQVVKVEKS